MGQFSWIDGKIIPNSRAFIPILDSSYLYGIGLFETMRASRQHLLLWKWHYQRLAKNAKIIGLKLPVSSQAYQRAVLVLLRRNNLREAMVRLMLSETEDGKPRLVITAKPFQAYPLRCYLQGARVCFAKSFSADSKSLSRVKTTSYLSKMIPRREAAKRGMDEALMVNEEGDVTEGASSNLFLVKHGVLITPPLSGLLPGTRRRFVLQLAKKLKIPVREEPISPRDLYTADEVFITSSLKDIMPVGFLEGKRLKGHRVLTERLQSEYRKTLTL